MPEGILVVDKPVGWSSFQVVHRIRKLTGVKKVGHAGTLDPFASGVLVIALGRRFTREIESIQAMPKRYQFRIVFGIETATVDVEGDILRVESPVNASVLRFLEDSQYRNGILDLFCGEIEQVPPQFSAKKKNGVPAYHLARQGIEVALAANRVRIDSLTVLSAYSQMFPTVDCEMICSKGTYVRSIVRDIASAMGTVAYTQALVRMNVGGYQLSDAVSLNGLSEAGIHAAIRTEIAA
ncbi:tRNA pseudouridine(55) synthase TruB [bacterium]|nr:tRNA pseudouridine(55) synthase TruB [bacterium]